MTGKQDEHVTRALAQAEKLERLAAHNKASAEKLKAEAAQQMEQHKKNAAEAASIRRRYQPDLGDKGSKAE